MATVLKVDFRKPTKLTGQEKVNLRDVHSELKSSRDFSNWAAYYLPNFEEGQDYGLLNKSGEQENHSGKSGAGHNRKDYWITVSAAKELAMMQTTAEGKAVRKYFLECEKLVYGNGLESQISSVPDILSPDFIIRLATELKEERHRADEAIRTKALIGSKREATAMNAASQANTKLRVAEAQNEDLRAQIGEATDLKTSKGWIKEFPAFGLIQQIRLGHQLKNKTLAMGLIITKVPDVSYGTVNAYPRAAAEALARDLPTSQPA